MRTDRETEVKTLSIGLNRYKIHDGASLASVEGLDDLVIARRNSCRGLEISIAAVMLSVVNCQLPLSSKYSPNKYLEFGSRVNVLYPRVSLRDRVMRSTSLVVLSATKTGGFAIRLFG
jgi:hypothetical protein